MPASEPTVAALPNVAWRYVLATRPAFLTITAIGCLIGLGTAYASGITINPIKAVVTIIFALVAHAGVNVFNDYYDALNGSDDANTDRLYPFTGGSRFIQNGVLTLAQTARFGLVLFVIVMLAGIWLMRISASGLFYIGLAGLFIGWAYSAPPLKLNSRGWGELCVATGFSLVIVGADFVQRAAFAGFPAIASVSYALLVTNILYINQFPDRKADALAGKRHWVVRLPPAQARWGYVLIATVAYLWLLGAVVMGALGWPVLIAFGALIPAISAAHELLRHADQPSLLRGAITKTIGSTSLHGLLLAAGLVVSYRIST